MIAVKMNAGNDRNGNPRRVYVILNDRADIVGTHDEGYAGDHGFRQAFPDVPIGPTFAITPGEYRELVKLEGSAER